MKAGDTIYKDLPDGTINQKLSSWQNVELLVKKGWYTKPKEVNPSKDLPSSNQPTSNTGITNG